MRKLDLPFLVDGSGLTVAAFLRREDAQDWANARSQIYPASTYRVVERASGRVVCLIPGVFTPRRTAV